MMWPGPWHRSSPVVPLQPPPRAGGSFDVRAPDDTETRLARIDATLAVTLPQVTAQQDRQQEQLDDIGDKVHALTLDVARIATTIEQRHEWGAAVFGGAIGLVGVVAAVVQALGS